MGRGGPEERAAAYQRAGPQVICDAPMHGRATGRRRRLGRAPGWAEMAIVNNNRLGDA